MNKITEVVNIVEQKLKKLIENYSFLKEENKFLIQKISVLENQISKNEQLYNELNQKYTSLKIAKTIEGSKEDRRETKLKINALIREVDVCIKQLSE
jgi:site-specific DNA-adenine methylase